MLLVGLFLIFKTYALSPLECGEYEFKGKILKSKNYFDIVINEKSMSEYRLIISDDDILTFTPYLNRTITGTVLFESRPELKQTKIGKISNLEISLPDVFDPMKNSYINKVKNVDCKK